MLKQRIIPLVKMVGIEQKLIKEFSKLGIDSAEELVALAATPGGLDAVARYLGVDKGRAKKLVEDAKKKLPVELREKLSRPSDLPVMFGARIPKRRKQFEAARAAHPERPLKRSASQFSKAIATAPAVTAPSEVNLIPQMTRIKDQGSRGTCVAFACVAAREFIAGSKPDLSEQYLYWWCDAHDPVPEEPGTTVEMGFTGLVEDGVCLESTWRYRSTPIDGNEGQGPPPDAAKNEAKDYKLAQMMDLDENAVNELKNCLKGTDELPGRPIAFSVPVYNSWLKSMAVQLSGQITMPLPGEKIVGGHAMVLVGYQDDNSVPGGGFFILRNSWGNAWGLSCPYGSGYGTIPYQYISNYCWEAFTGDAKPNGKKCFIATAAYGSPYAEEVQFLRNFRDFKLKPTPGGSAFVEFYENIYYRFSPQIAEQMDQNESKKNILRWVVVAPIVFVLRKAVGLIERGKR
ncbi:CFI-box-CTERM domain-containing protein [[Eubacterium] cellulosolvens]